MREPLQLINFWSARAMIEVFDMMYKMGVAHAHSAYGVEEVAEFLDRTERTWVYGVMGEEKTFGWQQWKAKLYFWMLEVRGRGFDHLQSLMREAYVQKSVLACFIPLTFRFYTQGLTDRMQCTVSDIVATSFGKVKHVRLGEYAARGVATRRLKERDYIAVLQHFAYDLAEQERTSVSTSRQHGPERYVKFAEAFWRVISAHRSGQRAKRIEAKLEKAKEEELIKRLTYGDHAGRAFDGMLHG